MFAVTFLFSYFLLWTASRLKSRTTSGQLLKAEFLSGLKKSVDLTWNLMDVLFSKFTRETIFFQKKLLLMFYSHLDNETD